MKLSAFIHDYWLPNYVELEGNLKIRTIQGYRQLLPRIEQSLGHLYLDRITPNHLLSFYQLLLSGGIRNDGKQHPLPVFHELFALHKHSSASLAKISGVSATTINSVRHNHNVSYESAKLLSEALQRSIEELFEPTQHQRPLSSATVRKYHNIISSMFTRAKRWGYVHNNPCERVDPPKVRRLEAVHLDEFQAQQLLQLLESQPEQYRVMIHVLLFTGMRRGELMGLEWQDIDFEHSLLHICRTSQYTPERGVYTDTTKTESSQRAVKLSASLIEILQQWKEHQTKTRLSLGDRWSAEWYDEPRLFTQWDGKVMHPDTISSWFSNFIQTSDLPQIHIHSLRHTNASLMIAAGTPVTAVANRLGHASVDTTTKVYSHAIQSANEAAAQTIENLLNPTQIKQPDNAEKPSLH